MPANTARLVREKIQQYAQNPASLANNVKKLQGREVEYRLRVDAWRVIFSQDGIVLTIRKVSPRGSAYEIRAMNKPNIITTPSGDRMVIIPVEEYERLVAAADDAADLRDVDAIKRKLAAGEEELIPADVVNRIIDGENKIRVWREYRGMSGKELAEKTGLAAPYISQLETGAREGTIETFKKIAAALRVDIDDIA
jgi:DNA-binding XRE family transcriptional regulator/mRNA-degrading endonuclease RelE of RelBE toxin-antitoxin system/PHD/YefM family antitoxin component YafN of YafNO toxin-antitoxin module